MPLKLCDIQPHVLQLRARQQVRAGAIAAELGQKEQHAALMLSCRIGLGSPVLVSGRLRRPGSKQTIAWIDGQLIAMQPHALRHECMVGRADAFVVVGDASILGYHAG